MVAQGNGRVARHDGRENGRCGGTRALDLNDPNHPAVSRHPVQAHQDDVPDKEGRALVEPPVEVAAQQAGMAMRPIGLKGQGTASH